MLKIENKKNSQYNMPHDEISFISDKEINSLHFECDDGVSFDIKNNNKSNSFTYIIPRGMNGQSYTVSINEQKEESVRLIVEENMIKHRVFYQERIGTIKTFDSVYDNKTFVSMNDLQKLFDGSEKAFTFSKINSSKILLNGIERRYFLKEKMGEYFIYLNSFYLAFDIQLEVLSDGTWKIKDGINIDLKQLNQNNYFSYMHGVLLADIDSGEIFFKKNENNVCAIASTTKLMTLLLTREKIEEGVIGYDTLVPIPEESERESLSEDGVIYLEEGNKVPVFELMHSLMLPSSNESAIALGCLISGSEEKFASLMNEKCKELGLEKSYFYNASGLPHYDDTLCSGKIQNRMTALEMFKLITYIVKTYPDLLEITSKKEYFMPSLKEKITNTNTMLWNMDHCIGLKTGTTNRAGCCLVALCEMNNRRVASIILGAESSEERTEASEILLKWASRNIH